MKRLQILRFFFMCIFIRIVPVNLEAPCVYSFGTLLKNH
jgi:hypothetical protein